MDIALKGLFATPVAVIEVPDAAALNARAIIDNAPIRAKKRAKRAPEGETILR